MSKTIKPIRVRTKIQAALAPTHLGQGHIREQL